MQVGLLWFDNDPHRGVTLKIADAAQRYREKFGRCPDTCYVNSAALGGEPVTTSQPIAQPTLRVVPAANILPHYFWVGEEEEHII